MGLVAEVLLPTAVLLCTRNGTMHRIQAAGFHRVVDVDLICSLLHWFA